MPYHPIGIGENRKKIGDRVVPAAKGSFGVMAVRRERFLIESPPGTNDVGEKHNAEGQSQSHEDKTSTDGLHQSVGFTHGWRSTPKHAGGEHKRASYKIH